MQNQEVPWLNLEYFFNKFFDFIENFIPFVTGKVSQVTGFGYGFLKYVAFALILVGVGGVVYLLIKLFEMKTRKRVYFSDFFEETETAAARKDTWGGIKRRLDSGTDDDWELAVIEADTLVDGIMTRIGYRGVTLGDKIKSIDEKNFVNLKVLWEAHVARKLVDEGGPDYKITKDEAKDALDKFEKALKELKYL